MEIESIAERAKAAFPLYEGMCGEKNIFNNEHMRMAYQIGAQEQDRIARNEERERCIEQACEQYRKELTQMVRVMNLAHKGSGNIIIIDGSVEDFRKALEGGEG